MNKQYIGARYVPIFADPVEWDNNRSYEPLTIVTYGGSSYTSKTLVPSGVDISDKKYWVLTGAFNAQLNAMVNEVNDLHVKVTKLTPSTFIAESNEPYIGVPEHTSFVRSLFALDTPGLYAVTTRIIAPELPTLNAGGRINEMEYYIVAGKTTDETFESKKIVRRIVAWDKDIGRNMNIADTVTYLFNLTADDFGDDGFAPVWLDAFSYQMQAGDENVPLNCTSYVTRLATY